MLPGTRRVVYIGGAGPVDVAGRAIFVEAMREKQPQVPVDQITGLSLAETLRRVATLPADAFVYTAGIFVDGDGQRFVGQASANRIIAASNRPVFVLARSAIGTGAVGGILSDFGAEAREAVRDALQAVRTGPPPVERRTRPEHTAPVFDWRQLQRWGIDEARLPPDALVLYREPTSVARYRGWIALAGLQLGLIAILLAERHQRRLASKAAAISESLNQSVIASLSGRIAVLDASGTILQVNATWGPPAPDDPGAPLAGADPGSNVRAAWPARGVEDTPPPLLDTIEAVLLGQAPERTLEFALAVGDDPRFFRWLVQALDRPEGGAIVSLLDITDGKRAELEARRSLQDVAHAARVVTLGELTASLAHEINQPLGAILANAESGERVLASPSPDLPLLAEILSDITISSERAGEVIRRMRAMLRKGDSARVAVDSMASSTTCSRSSCLKPSCGAWPCGPTWLTACRRCSATPCSCSRCCSTSWSMPSTRSATTARASTPSSCGRDASARRWSSPSRTTARVWRPTRCRGSSSPSSRRRPRASGWAWPSSGQSSRPTAAPSPRPRTTAPA